MKSLYQFLMEHMNDSIKLYNLSYDICEKEDEDTLHNDTFVLYLYDQKIISDQVEFLFVDENNQRIEDEKFFVVKPAETTIIFGSKKSMAEILDELTQHDELCFSLQELEIIDNKAKGLVINNYNTNADKEIKSKVKSKKDPELDRMIKLMNIEHPLTIKVKVIKK